MKRLLYFISAFILIYSFVNSQEMVEDSLNPAKTKVHKSQNTSKIISSITKSFSFGAYGGGFYYNHFFNDITNLPYSKSLNRGFVYGFSIEVKVTDKLGIEVSRFQYPGLIDDKGPFFSLVDNPYHSETGLSSYSIVPVYHFVGSGHDFDPHIHLGPGGNFPMPYLHFDFGLGLGYNILKHVRCNLEFRYIFQALPEINFPPFIAFGVVYKL